MTRQRDRVTVDAGEDVVAEVASQKRISNATSLEEKLKRKTKNSHNERDRKIRRRRRRRLGVCVEF